MKKLISLMLALACILSCTVLTSCGETENETETVTETVTKTELDIYNYDDYIALNASVVDFGYKNESYYVMMTLSAKKAKENVKFESVKIKFKHTDYGSADSDSIIPNAEDHTYTLSLNPDGEGTITICCAFLFNYTGITERDNYVKTIESISGYVIE